jgi:hypothetical protein
MFFVVKSIFRTVHDANRFFGPVVELVDAQDSKSCVRKGMSVRVRPGPEFDQLKAQNSGLRDLSEL